MKIRQISYLNVGENRNHKRIWIEGKRLAQCGFIRGASFVTTLDVINKKILLTLDKSGGRIVSGRDRGGDVSPIVDLCSSEITSHLQKTMNGPVRVRLVFQAGVIEITAHEVHRNRVERESRIESHMASGEVTTGTLCAGGGVSCWALHDGLSDAGVTSTVDFILDIDGRYLQSAIDNNPHITDDTRIFEAALEEIDPQMMGRVDILNVSLPCTGFSNAGKAKNNLEFAEDHASAGTAVLGALQIIRAVNPCVVVFENVPGFKSSASCSLLTGYLRKLGYALQDRVMGREVGGCLEKRDRHFIVAISEGLSNRFDIDSVTACVNAPETMSEILDEVPADSDLWKQYDYLATKEIRDRENGKGFRRQLLSGEEDGCGTIGRGYQKARSTEPFIQSPFDSRKSRLLSPAEHARVKGIPENIVSGLSATIAHEILGQSVLFGVFRSIGRAIAEGLKGKKMGKNEIIFKKNAEKPFQMTLFAA